MRNQANARQDGVMTYKRQVPDWMKQVTVDCGLHYVEQGHRNERRVIACSIPVKALLVFLSFRQIWRVKKNREHVKRDRPNDQHEKFVKAPLNLGVPFERHPPLQY
jgi:hypothetical protein